MLVARAYAGLPEELLERAADPIPIDSDAGAALNAAEPVVVPDWAVETRFRQSPLMQAAAVRSGAVVAIRSDDRSWGVLAVRARAAREFAPDELNFLNSLAHVLATAIQRQRSEDEVRRRALHDPLTGLPNRALFLDRLGHALDRARRGEGRVAVLFLDVDHFKLINDSLGHQAGDALLTALAARLSASLRPSDTIARLGGDEFVLLCEGLGDERSAVLVAERVLADVALPFSIEGHDVRTTATIGAAIARHGDTAAGLIRDADAALYRAKAGGRARCELFDDAMRRRVSVRLSTEAALRRALADGALELRYQPVVSLADARLVGAEALVRWHDPERGEVPPSEFIPIAEETGLINALGAWVIERAASDAGAWPATPGSGTPLTVAVNLSARQVAQRDFAIEVRDVLARSGLEARRMEVEITEAVLTEDAEAPADTFRALGRLGVAVALDDFGAGESSLSALNRLPLDILKLDRSFVAPLGAGGSPVVEGLVAIAQRLGLTVVAVGVETRAQLDALRALGCRLGQGYYFARPLAAPEFANLARTGVVTPGAA